MRNIAAFLVREAEGVDSAPFCGVDRYLGPSSRVRMLTPDREGGWVETVSAHVREADRLVRSARQCDVRSERDRVAEVVVHEDAR